MSTLFLKAQHYHDQATNLRKIAAMDEDEERRRALIEIADSYDELALKFMASVASTAQDKS